MLEVIVFAGFISLGVWIYYLDHNRERELKNDFSKLNRLLGMKNDIHKTLLAGIYQRFKKEEGKTVDTPYDFEDFVAKVISEYSGIKATTTSRSGDGGIDFIQEGPNGLYLGQVKCYALTDAVNYVPIAILHSQIVRQGASGGVVVTTSHFNEGAIEYAKSVNIKLIDGEQFLEMWLHTIEKAHNELIPDFELSLS